MKSIYFIHKWSGLISGLFLLLLGLTGSVLVFHQELDNVIYENKFIRENPEGKIALDQAIINVQAAFPTFDLRVREFTEPDQSLVFQVRKDKKRVSVYVDPQSGKILEHRNSSTQFGNWLMALHYTLHLGIFGKITIFTVGVLFFISLISGFIFYRKWLLSTFLFRKKFRKQSYASSLHHLVGFWSVIFNLIIVLTGTLISYSVVTHALKEPSKSKEPFLLRVSVEEHLASLNTLYPDFQASFISVPHLGETFSVFGKRRGDNLVWNALSNRVTFSKSDGAITSQSWIRDRSFGDKLNSMLIPLHFGSFGGIWLKMLYCLFALSSPILSITGFLLWQRKRKKHRAIKKQHLKRVIKTL